SVFEVEELSKIRVRIPMKGTITVPLLGQIRATGLSPLELQDQISELLEQKYMHNPQVSVFVQEHQSQRVSVMGAVRKGGVLTLVSRLRLADALAMADGLADDADHTIYLVRQVPMGTVLRGQTEAAPPEGGVPAASGSDRGDHGRHQPRRAGSGARRAKRSASGWRRRLRAARRLVLRRRLGREARSLLPPLQDDRPAGRHGGRRPEGRRRLGGHSTLSREAERGARGPGVQS